MSNLWWVILGLEGVFAFDKGPKCLKGFQRVIYPLEPFELLLTFYSLFNEYYSLLLVSRITKAAAVLGRATLYALCAELLTGVEVIRHRELYSDLTPWLCGCHHAA